MNDAVPKRPLFRFVIALGLLFLAALALPIYPFVFLANVMGIAGMEHNEPQPMTLQGLAALYYLWGGILYPGVLLFAVVKTLAWWQQWPWRALAISAVPLIHLCGLLTFFAVVIWR